MDKLCYDKNNPNILKLIRRENIVHLTPLDERTRTEIYAISPETGEEKYFSESSDPILKEYKTVDFVCFDKYFIAITSWMNLTELSKRTRADVFDYQMHRVNHKSLDELTLHYAMRSNESINEVVNEIDEISKIC